MAISPTKYFDSFDRQQQQQRQTHGSNSLFKVVTSSSSSRIPSSRQYSSLGRLQLAVGGGGGGLQKSSNRRWWSSSPGVGGILLFSSSNSDTGTEDGITGTSNFTTTTTTTTTDTARSGRSDHHAVGNSKTHNENENDRSDNANNNTNNDNYKLELEVATSNDMEDVGAVLSVGTVGGDALLLGGDLGAGKTCLSRGFVRARTGCGDVRVTSPTYLLSNTYPVDGGDLLIHHMDLYRLSEGNVQQLGPLNLEFVLNNCISLIEWPSRLGSISPDCYLEIVFKIVDDKVDEEEVVVVDKVVEELGENDDEEVVRVITLIPHGKKWVDKLRNIEEVGYLYDMIIEYYDESVEEEE